MRLRFYEELNDFLPKTKRKQDYEIPNHFKRTVKDLIESEGVPHVEVDLILVNGSPVDFDYIVQDDDRISVYPVFESMDIGGVTKLNGRPLRNLRFILDVHLGKLAKYLRLFGFDTVYDNSYTDEKIASWSSIEDRVVLTRDKGLLKRSEIIKGYWLRHQQPKKQLQEIFLRFDLYNQSKPFTLCMICNGKLRQVGKRRVADHLPTVTRDAFNEFYQCSNCQKVYWKGSHYEKMSRFVESVRK